MEKRSRDCVTAWLKSYQGVERSSSTGERRIPQHHEGGRDQQQVVIINAIANVIINVIINAMAYSHHDNCNYPSPGAVGALALVEVERSQCTRWEMITAIRSRSDENEKL